MRCLRITLEKKFFLKYTSSMEKVTLKTLKESLSSVSEKVAQGKVIEVTKHGNPYFKMVPCSLSSVYTGECHGNSDLKPGLDRARTGKKFLSILLSDRDERF